MKIYMEEHTLAELYDGYKNNSENGIVAFGGLLDVRPPFQREFIYDDKQRDAVIDTINKGFPLNVMYWSKNDDGKYQLLDGQQRTLSALMYINNDFSVNMKAFGNLTNDQKEKILNYKCSIYICDGTQSEKLDWFKIINIAGLKLTDQELRNSQYTGEWLYDAKRLFSKTGCVAQKKGGNYVTAIPIRQELLELALKWICDRDNMKIENYMSIHQHDHDANELWTYFQNVIDWIEITFPNYRTQIMKNQDWGLLYNKYKDEKFNSNDLEQKISSLILDDEVTNKKGIYAYLLSNDEKHLNLRGFTESQRLAAYEKQGGYCAICKKHFNLEYMEADHITPWSQGGKTDIDNCQMLCRDCNRRKSNK